MFFSTMVSYYAYFLWHFSDSRGIIYQVLHDEMDGFSVQWAIVSPNGEDNHKGDANKAISHGPIMIGWWVRMFDEKT